MSDSLALLQSQGSSSDTIHRRVLEILGGAPELPLADLGCGQGSFLERLIASDADASLLTGVDGHEHAGKATTAWRFLKADLDSELPIESASLATVTAIEVIEHLENPRAFLREIHRVLRPGGLAVITTPNNESLTSLLSLAIRGHYSSFADSCYPAHITPLLEVDLRRMLTETSFESPRFSYTNEGRIPSSGLHWQKLGPFFRGRRFSDNLIVSAVKAR